MNVIYYISVSVRLPWDFQRGAVHKKWRESEVPSCVSKDTTK
jgi:hypothetical protein